MRRLFIDAISRHTREPLSSLTAITIVLARKFQRVLSADHIVFERFSRFQNRRA